MHLVPILLWLHSEVQALEEALSGKAQGYYNQGHFQRQHCRFSLLPPAIYCIYQPDAFALQPLYILELEYRWTAWRKHC